MDHSRQTLIVVMTVVAVVSLVTFGFTFGQVNQERDRLEADIEYRSSILASAVKDPIEDGFADKSKQEVQSVVNRFAGDQRIAALGITDSMDSVVASSSDLVKEVPAADKVTVDAMDSNKAKDAFVKYHGRDLYIFAEPIRNAQGVVGAVVVVQNAAYISNYVSDAWQRNVLRLLVQITIFSLAIIFILRWIVQRPLQRLLVSVRSTRKDQLPGNQGQIQNSSLFGPVLQEFSSIQKSLVRAREVAREATRSNIEKLDTPWTAERLHEFTKDLLKNRTIIAVSNREPYMHYKDGNQIRWLIPAGGVVTALDPVMRACGGMWIAHGNGDADRLVTNKEDKLQVPPDEPSYTLKRVWLTKKEEQEYYDGFANGGLWPLSHMVHTRPTFRQDDWEGYKKVNQKFADSVLKEIEGKKNPIVIIQDYHFALLPRMVKDARPDAAVCIFWHIPWPNSEQFSICPWKKEILDGLLGADIIGFHTQLFCNNFINTVGRELEALIDLEQFTVTKNEHTSFVKPFPISIDFTDRKVSKNEQKTQIEAARKLRKDLGITSHYLGVGVDRFDYTKGILERIKAIELFLRDAPQYQGEFTFVQIAAPSRTSVKEYQEFDRRVSEEIERINSLYKHGDWKPIILIKEHRERSFIDTLYRAADLCLVTPLHDGMNLVAKEFVAARNDEHGVLILSQFAGASQELREALVVNPYDGQASAETIRTALEMQPAEQARRMRKLRQAVKDHNVYRWSAEILKRISELD